jgi:hypothetical protein
MTKMLICALSFCLLGVLTQAEFPSKSRCKPQDKIGPMAARSIYGEPALKKDTKLANKTFAEAEKEKPAQTEKYCSLDMFGNKVS